ncbi:AbrB/MazE/SpoVT family DNA-binding domain-containing protein [Alkaliphilus peptidifermentans]|uniref:Transcriptional regulator/antitoxin, MazE n=1 Tax=Alkaliphilus peptidifermentans DSM 18978 TaxID=1120976 RepID=A0A1G5LFX9_9FIRM|nr:AbrB/MazE/SpoVT family DNA-binding domain-containing protein [Alkaliphilus peptidifermentans]SCZ11150.1 transcriptional regulator/antitoxin, MazE [Alkaliphilus peptidifermentans DSM 18978]
MKTTRLRKVGNSFGFTIPKELMEKYNLNEGVELHIIEQNDGFVLTPYDPEFEKWTNSFDKTNNKYKNTLRALSK